MKISDRAMIILAVATLLVILAWSRFQGKENDELTSLDDQALRMLAGTGSDTDASIESYSEALEQRREESQAKSQAKSKTQKIEKRLHETIPNSDDSEQTSGTTYRSESAGQIDQAKKQQDEMETAHTQPLEKDSGSLFSGADKNAGGGEENGQAEALDKPERFLKLGVSGEVLDKDAARWFCVYDKATQLVWEVKNRVPSLNAKEDMYRWTSPDAQVSDSYLLETKWDVTCNLGKVMKNASCNTGEIETAFNMLAYCGLLFWRLPSTEELMSIVSPNRKNSSINIEYFPETIADVYWTDNPFHYSEYRSTVVIFRGGKLNDRSKSKPAYVRLVSGPIQLLDN